MFFFSLALFLAASWTAPWWVAGVIGFAMGALREMTYKESLHFSSACALAWASLSYVHDGRNFGLISARVGGLLGLPHFSIVFLIMGLIGFVTVFLCLQSGQALRRLFKAPTNSVN